MVDRSVRQLKVGLGALAATAAIGTAGYMALEHWSFLDALYMTVIAVTTTGFKEVHMLSDTGRVFTLFLIILGVSSIAYTGGRGVQVLLESQILRKRRMNRKLSSLNDHFIVCGYGKMGKFICEELTERRADFVIIENNSGRYEQARELEYMTVEGDATDDDTLIEAGIKKARGLVAVLSSDADNVFATLSAKSLNPGIFVVARAVEEETAPKLRKAGADRVVKPYETAGTKMAELLLRPGVNDFIDVVARDSKVDLNLEEMFVTRQSPLAGKTLGESSDRRDLNVIVVMVNKPDGRFIYNPKSSTPIEAGDRLIALGERLELMKFSKLCTGE